MKNRLVWVTILSLFFMASCSDKGISIKQNEIEYNKVRAVVWNYLQEHGTPFTKDVWVDAEVKKVTYNDKKVYAVFIKNALASPIVYVDPDSYKVIGVKPGS